MGDVYHHVAGIEKNDTNAVRWFALASKQGLALAQVNLASMYRNGRGVPRDPYRLFGQCDYSFVRL
jgi:TPR repeat protein